MRMGYQWLMFMIAPAMLFSCTRFVVVEAVAQELLQCFVESMPCGTPAELDSKVRKCLRDPYLCRNHKVSVADTTNSDHSPATKVLAVLARAGVALPGPAARPVRAPFNVEATPADDPSRAIDDMANDLPLDSETRGLSDTMPTQPARIERRLGLRRTQVAVTDMRNRSPSPAEIVQALAPRERAPE